MISIQRLLVPIIVIFFYSSISVYSQSGTIRGFVYEKESGEPVIYTNVILIGTTYGAATDVNGFYTITGIKPGNYQLQVTNLGYDTLRVPVFIKGDQIIDKNLFLSKASYMLQTVDVSAQKQEMRTETRTSVIKITPKDMKQIPSIGGQADLAQYLQVLPGVVFTGDQGGQLYIRGGSPIQNKVLLDGMVVYNPFHSIGLFSVFDTDILRNVEVYTGGFDAEYSGSVASVMDLTTRDGNKKHLSGKVGANTFGAHLLVEGPIKKQTENGTNSASFVISAKNSYLEESSKLLYNYVDSAGLPFNYTDLYGKISLNTSNGSKFNFFGFNFNDKVNNYKSLSDFHWKASGAGTKIVVVPGNSPVLLEGNLAYSNYEILLEEKTAPTRSSKINGFNMGLHFTYFMNNDALKYGIEMLGFGTEYNLYQDNPDWTTELGVYAKYKINTGKFILVPSFRLQWYISALSPEPRFSMKYNATDKLRLKLAAGMYSQNLFSARSDRDVVNLFYGFLSEPDLPNEFKGEKVTNNLQKAEHIVVGAEYDIFKNATINIEGYYTNFSQLVNLNRNEISLSERDNIFIIETGDAEGIDFTFKYERQRYYLWAVYSFAYVNRYYENDKGDITHYYPHFDRRHNVNIVGSILLGPLMRWEINARWNYGSPFPFTKTAGFYEKLNFVDGINTNYITENGELGIIYDDLNTGRMTPYHRLDISIQRTFYFTERIKLNANLSVTNVYNNRWNIFYVDRYTNEKVYQLPIMPSFGISLEF